MGVVTSILLDALLSGVVALILCTTSREFEFFNLAAGVWLIVGGWAGTVLVGTGVSVHLGWFGTLAALAGLQIGSPLIFRERIRENPLAYLFVSLGTALVALNIISTELLKRHGAIIPLEGSETSFLVFGVAGILIVGVVYILFHSHRWAELVLTYRMNSEDKPVYRRLSALIGLEIVLLLLIGGASSMVHKGQVDVVQYRTLVPLLAIISTRMSPIWGPVVAILFTLAGHIIMLGSSKLFTGGAAAAFARPVVTFLLILYIFFKSRPTHVIRETPVVTPLMPRETNGLSRSNLIQYIFAGLAITIPLALSTDLLGPAQELISSQTAGYTLFVMALASIAWIGQQYLGVLSITWPAFGLIAGYIIVHSNGSLIVMLLGIGVSFVVAVFYFWQIRIRKNEPALVLDLAALMTIYLTLKNAPEVAGANEVVSLPDLLKVGFNIVPNAGVQLSVVLIAIVTSTFIAWGFRIRAPVLGMANLRLGLMHGVRVRTVFSISVAILVVLAVISSLGYHAASYGFLSLETLSVEFGLIILLFGYILHRAEIGFGFLMLALVFLVVEGVLSGSSYVNAVVGSFFIGIPFVLQEKQN